MKKTVIVFGLISGLIISSLLTITTICYSSNHFEGSEVLGYAGMLVAFSFIFVGIKNYRDKYNGGVISFGKAFMTGLYITLIGSTMYVLAWLIIFYNFMPDFMEKYSAYMINQAKASGLTQTELNKKVAQMSSMKEMYKSTVFVILMTYLEILPVGLIVSLISAVILKRKSEARSQRSEVTQ